MTLSRFSPISPALAGALGAALVLMGCAEDEFGMPYTPPALGPTGVDEPSTDEDPWRPMDVDDDDEEDPDNAVDVDDYIYSLGHLELPSASAKAPIPCDPTTMDCPAPWDDDQGRTCTLVYYSETKHLDHFASLNPESPALWPGAVLRGRDVLDGFLSPIGVDRAPVTFSLSLENLSQAPSATMESPSLSAFRNERNRILSSGTTGATPAQINYVIHSVESRSQLSFFLGASVEWGGVINIDALFDFNDGDFAYRYLFDFTQTYYTADLDTPPRPSSFFQGRVTVDDLEQFMGPESPPMYVQSIAYGRRVVFAIESNDTLSKIVSAVDAAFAGIAEVDIDSEARDTLGAAKITAGVIGGDGGAAVKTILGVEQLLQFITDGGDYSASSPGAPIAYKVAYLDNAPARFALTAEYPEASCQ